MYCEKCGKRLLEGEICSCQNGTNLKKNTKKMNTKNTNINFYVMISFLVFIFAGELAYYFYVNAGVGNFLDYLPGRFIKEYQNYFIYGLLLIVLTAGAFCGILAMKEKTAYIRSIIAFALNFLGIAAVGIVLGVSMYQSYKNVSAQADKEAPIDLQNNSVLNETEPYEEFTEAITETQTEEVTEKATEEQMQTEDEEAKMAEFVETVLQEAEALIQEGELEKAQQILGQAYSVTNNTDVLNKLYEISDLQTSVPYEEEGSYEEGSYEPEEYEDIEIMLDDMQLENEDSEIFEPGIHSYAFVQEDTTWEEAYCSCIAMGGHIVTFESQEEFAYVTQQLKDAGCEKVIFFIGGRRDMNSQEYHWIDTSNKLIGDKLNDPSAWNSECWLQDEPSFEDTTLNIQENVMNMFYYDDLEKWVWNDVPNDLLSVASYYSGKIGYICEYED